MHPAITETIANSRIRIAITRIQTAVQEQTRSLHSESSRHLAESLSCLAAALLLSATACTGVLAQDRSGLLAPIFGDRAVLQRDAPIDVWGTAGIGDSVTVELAGREVRVRADTAGKWSATLPALSAGGPFTLRAASSSGAVAQSSNILIGDVFLCSGQSNMELPVSRTLDSRAVIGRSANDRIRMVTIEKASSPVVRDAFSGRVEWEAARPETVPDWSGTCYYFADKLQETIDVPIGLIHSSWGGSSIRAWMSADALSSLGGYDAALEILRLYADGSPKAQQQFGSMWEAWWREASGDQPGTEPWNPDAARPWQTAPPELGNWRLWGNEDLRDDNLLWMRTSFALTSDQSEQDATLVLGPVDEIDQTWINGRVLGNTFGWGTERRYEVPAELLLEGENVVVVNVVNTYGEGGLVGDAPKREVAFANGSLVPLEGWKYLAAPDHVGLPPRSPWESIAGLSTLYNAMIAPLGSIGLSGVVWYQGESDTDKPEIYRDLLTALMAQWRDQFGSELPVLVVQLANYGAPPTAPEESGWAELREAQRMATQTDPNAGLVVTIDIGSAYDLHPANKNEVGRRLARAARHVIYGEPLSPSGPVPSGAVRRDSSIVVSFSDVQGSLVAYSNPSPIGFELCGETAGSCRYADAEIEGEQVLLRPAAHGVTRVRYCWGDSPVCTLYDASGLPAGPFELRVDE